MQHVLPLACGRRVLEKKNKVRYPPGSKIAPVPRTPALRKHRSKLMITQGNEPIGRYKNLDTQAVPVAQARRVSSLRRSPAKRRSSSNSNSKPTRTEAIARGTPSGQYNDSDEEEIEAELETEAVPIEEARRASSPRRSPAKRKLGTSSKPTHVEATARKSDGGNGHRSGDEDEDDRKPPAKRTKLEPAVEAPDREEMDTSCVVGNADDDERLSTKKCQGISLDILFSDKDVDTSLVEKRFAQLASEAVDGLAKALRLGIAWPLSAQEYHGALFNGEDPWCKLKARSGESQRDLKHHFALHGIACTHRTDRAEERCEACEHILPRVKQLCNPPPAMPPVWEDIKIKQEARDSDEES